MRHLERRLVGSDLREVLLVILSEAKDLDVQQARSFASLRMTLLREILRCRSG